MSRIYQVVLLWLRDPDLFGRYQVAAAPVAARYGAAERTLRRRGATFRTRSMQSQADSAGELSRGAHASTRTSSAHWR